MRCPWLCCVIAALVTPVRAEMQPSLTYVHYEVQPEANESLSDALYRQSPIREEGRVYHGHTQWSIEWRFWWRETPNQRCRIDQVKVSVTARIRLPQLVGGTPAQRQRFDKYQAALNRHELGHYRLATQAGEAIDAHLRNLPSEASCRTLETVANEAGHRIQRRYRELNDQYERDTRHGRSQGAWLGE